jgi:hypothetical protein
MTFLPRALIVGFATVVKVIAVIVVVITDFLTSAAFKLSSDEEMRKSRWKVDGGGMDFTSEIFSLHSYALPRLPPRPTAM